VEQGYVYELFEYLHAHPELGMEEKETSAFLAGELEKYGYKVIRNVGGKTGVIGILDGQKPGKTVALRADMDALPYTIDGVCTARHTCGHDAHSSMVMAAARTLAEQKISRGRLMIVFQPAEETLGGAKSMIESGLLDEVDEIMGIHIRPKEEMAFGQATCGLCHGASFTCRVRVKGISAHGARPQQGVNAIEAAIAMIQSIYAIHVDPRISHSFKVTRFQGGGAATNIIPDSAEFALDIRCQDNQEMDRIQEKIRRIAAGTAEAFGAEAEVELNGVPGAEYDEDMVKDAGGVISAILGPKNAKPPIKTPGGEDFHFYTRMLPHCKAAYVGLGAEAYPGLHHKDMEFRHEAMEYGVKILVELAKKRLE